MLRIISRKHSAVGREVILPGERRNGLRSKRISLDNVLAHKRTLRVYGEFTTAKMNGSAVRPGSPHWLDLYRDFGREKGAGST